MIHSLEVHNFLSHKETYLEFHPGVNVIIGNSDSGKSALINAFRWVIWNRPQGDSIRSNWGGRTAVTLTLQGEGKDRIVIERSKDKQDEYRLNDKVFRAFRTDVPEEISTTININEINLQMQLEPHFLLSKSPGEVSTHFNKIVQLDKIDIGVQNIQSKIRELTLDIKSLEIQEQNLQERIKAFDYLETLEIEVEALETMESQRTSLRSVKSRLINLLNKLLDIQQQLEDFKQILQLGAEVDKIISYMDNRNELLMKVDRLGGLLQTITDHNIYMDELKDVASAEQDILSLHSLYNNKETLKKQQISIAKALSALSNINVLLNKAKANLSNLSSKFEEAFPIGSICPLCGKPK